MHMINLFLLKYIYTVRSFFLSIQPNFTVTQSHILNFNAIKLMSYAYMFCYIYFRLHLFQSLPHLEDLT